MTGRTRHRFRIALAVILCLLFQQGALAAYWCPMEQMPAGTAAMVAHCAGMGMALAHDNPALCVKHCNPDHAAATDAAKLSVPPLALPAMLFVPADVRPVSSLALQSDVPIARSDPPPRLRYCSLLI